MKIKVLVTIFICLDFIKGALIGLTYSKPLNKKNTQNTVGKIFVRNIYLLVVQMSAKQHVLGKENILLFSPKPKSHKKLRQFLVGYKE